MLPEDRPLIEVQEMISLGKDLDTGEDIPPLVNVVEVTLRELRRGEWEKMFPNEG